MHVQYLFEEEGLSALVKTLFLSILQAQISMLLAQKVTEGTGLS